MVQALQLIATLSATLFAGAALYINVAEGADIGWLVAALFIGSVVPFTFIVVMPTNKKLLDPARDLTSAQARTLIERWNKLHAVRTVLSLVASILYVWLLHDA